MVVLVHSSLEVIERRRWCGPGRNPLFRKQDLKKLPENCVLFVNLPDRDLFVGTRILFMEAGTLMKKKQVAVIALGLWLTIISLSMLFAGRIDFALFFVLGFIGFLVIVELMEPYYVKPGYVVYIRFLMTIGIVLFVAIVAQKLLEIMGLEIVWA